MPQSTGNTIAAHGATDRGKVRPENEDAYFVDEKRSVYAVADGLGGLPEGALASTKAIETLEAGLRKHPEGPLDLENLFADVNNAVIAAGRGVGNEIGIGTTLTVAVFEEDALRIAHLGDTGIYRLRGGELEKLTVDHTMAQEMLERFSPEERASAYIPEYYHHTLTRCIGRSDNLGLDQYRYEWEPGDRLLLFSDGVTKVIDEAELARHLGDAESPEACVNAIIQTANERGGPDNITAVAVFVG